MVAEAAQQHRALVKHLQAAGHLRSERVAQAFLRVPRAHFLPPHVAAEAYDDRPVQIGFGQTISAPHMVAIMLEALELAPGVSVLEVGGGSGYHAALAAELVMPGGRVVSVEIVPELAARARATLERTGHAGVVEVVAGDGSLGWPDAGPYDRIFVSCAAPAIPPPLAAQLVPGGVMLVPVGTRGEQRLLRVRKDVEGRATEEEDLGGCVFVPLLGKHGFT